MGRKYAHFDKENTQVANEYKKTCQYRQPLGKWKITMMMKYTSHALKWLQILIILIGPNAGEDSKKPELSCIAGGHVK